MILLVIASFLALATAQSTPATVVLNFGRNFPCNGTHIKNVEVNLCAQISTSFTTLTQQYTLDGSGNKIVTLQTPGLSQVQPCTVAVRESTVLVKRNFTMFGGQTYRWDDLTSDLTIHIEWWNPWCALSPINNCNRNVFNGARLTLQHLMPTGGANPIVFRQYSDKPAICGDLQTSWDCFPRLANGNYFGENFTCDATGGFFNAPTVVGILRTVNPITVYAEEYRNELPYTSQGDCDPQVWTVGHNGVIYPPNEAPQQTITVDRDCNDGSCDSGVLISRLQVPNLCTEPNPDNREKLGQFIGEYPNGPTQFPATSLILTWRTGTTQIQTFPVRWYAGEPNTRLDYYVVASNSYEVGAQYPAAPCPTPDLTVGSLVKVPIASCLGGSCEAQPITSTLYLDTQGHCEDLRDITIRQQSYSQTGTTTLFSNFNPNCDNVTEDGRLLFCVFNLRNTEITVEYNLHGTANTVDVDLPVIDCQNTEDSQVCRSPGGLATLCPDWGCIGDINGNGPTQLNMAITYDRANTDYVLHYEIASPADLINNHNGCLWVPGLGQLKLTVSEGCCEYPVTNGVNDGGFTGCGCVQAVSNTTICLPNQNCTSELNFGRLLTVFDLAYLPEDPGVQTTSVSLEAPSTGTPCCPFRFKTQEGGAPRCYCVLPIELRARIIETNLDTRAQACKCTNVESCVQKYTPERESDCSICDFLSAFHFDLTGLPSWTTARLYSGPAGQTSQDAGMKLLRDYPLGVGGVNNWKSVLRTGDQDQAPCCENQTYCLVVEENAASLERCVSCVGKICTPRCFTRSMCLNLESPCPDGSISNLLDVSLFVQGSVNWPFSETAPTRMNNDPTQWVRTVYNQGGVNGCAATPIVKKRDTEPEQADAELFDAEVLLSMTEEELLDYEAEQAVAYRTKEDRARAHVLAGINNGRYTVLALPYTVGVFEGNARVYKDSDCSCPENGALPACNASDFINCLCWNTTCTGHAIGQQGQNGGSIPSDNLWVTLGTQDLNEPIIMGAQGWSQIRGPKGYWSQNLTTCDWSRKTFINATWVAAGNQYQCVPVLTFNRLALRVEEGLILPPAPIWPDPRGHPTVTVEVDCEYAFGIIPSGPNAGHTCRQTNLKPDCYCRVEPPQIFSLWEIISVRGIPSQGNQLVFKYTDPDQQKLSNQGVFRNVPATHLAVGSGLETDMSTWVPGYNYFCMVADPKYAFSFNWGDYAYPFSGGELTPRPNAIITNFNCDARVAPYANQIFDWQEGLNMCRGCSLANVDGGPLVRNPCLFGGGGPTNRVCNVTDSERLSPSTSYSTLTNPKTILEENSKLCRVSWVLTGSDNGADLPLDQIFVIPFY